MPHVITNNLDLWTSALITKSTTGRGSNGKQDAYGIKKLRELILELAVMGKLVPQDSSDEPAKVVLERIAETKKKSLSRGDTKARESSQAITDDVIPYQLPDGWEWVRFIDVLDFQGGSQPPKSQFSETKLDGYVQLIQIRDLGPSPQPIFVPVKSVSKFCTEEDIMIGRYGASVGKVFWGKDGAYNVALIKLIDEFDVFGKRFLFNLMQSPLGQSYFSGISRSAQDGFSKNDIAQRLVPVPPINEQHRIVTKVDELLAMCDQLEQQQAQNIEAHQTLVETLLGTLTRVESQQELTEAWTRIANHFNTLFITEHSINQLKQTILQLAVMGKLVPQDVNDEPATVLLAKIGDEKRQLIEVGKIREQGATAPISEEERPFEVPSWWQWARLSEITRRIHYGYTASAKPEIATVRLLRITDIQNNTVDWPSVPGCEIAEADLPQYQLELGDILIARTGGTVGKTYLVREIPVIAVFASYLIRIQGASAMYVRYLKLFLESPMYWKQLIEGARGGAQPNVNGQTLGRMVVPVPPNSEQHHIVVKVDELMALCDDLKARLADAQTTQIHLADTIVEQATE